MILNFGDSSSFSLNSQLALEFFWIHVNAFLLQSLGDRVKYIGPSGQVEVGNR